jgi:hypothetical protein
MLYYALIALAVLAAVLVLFLIVVAMQPSQFRIERKGKITAPPAIVFGHVNDLHKWTSWSPWEKLDPELKRTYDGAAAGTGAQYAWSGNNKVGQGKMTIVESRPSELIRIQLEFIRPFTATNISEFTFQQEGNKTNVTWSMTGTNNFMAKAFGLLMNMDKLVGSDFEKGLAGMKAVAEAPAT